jgi:hypothetical protein
MPSTFQIRHGRRSDEEFEAGMDRERIMTTEGRWNGG